MCGGTGFRFGGHDISLAQATEVYGTDNCVVLDWCYRRSIVAARAVGVFSNLQVQQLGSRASSSGDSS